MDIPEQFKNYRCADYFASEHFEHGGGIEGIWAHYPIADDFVLVAPGVNALVEGWLAGDIEV